MSADSKSSHAAAALSHAEARDRTPEIVIMLEGLAFRCLCKTLDTSPSESLVPFPTSQPRCSRKAASPSTMSAKGKKSGHKRADADTNTGPRDTAPSIPVDIDEGPHALMKHACMTLLRTGTYIDTKFYVYSRRKESGLVFAPQAVYANGSVLRAKLPSYFDHLLGGSYGKNIVSASLDAPFPDAFESDASDYDYEDDSDFGDEEPDQTEDEAVAGPSGPSSSGVDTTEGDSSQIEPSASSATPGISGTTIQTMLIKTCAFNTWMAFIYYLYTGETNFAPLKSQSSKTASSGLPEQKSSNTCALPCSPKSMYRLADILGYDELKQTAEKDIQSKLSPENILVELFSSFTCTPGYKDIRDIEIEYAVKHARTTIATELSDYLDTLSADESKRSTAVFSSLVTKLVGSPSETQLLSTTYCFHCDVVNPQLQCYTCKTKLELF